MGNDPVAEPVEIFKSGAKRSERMPRYDLIPREGLRRLALRYEMGAKKYGEFNWKKGLADKEFIDQAKCHLIAHLWGYLENGNSADDNLAAVAWGVFALMESEKVIAEANDDREDMGLPLRENA